MKKSENPKKVIQLKQFMITGDVDPDHPSDIITAAFIVNTCAKTARDEFEAKTGLKVIQCITTADSDLTKEDLKTKDLWDLKRNWIEKYPRKESSPRVKQYLKLVEKANRVQELRQELKIKNWETVTDEQLSEFNRRINALK